MLKLIVIFMLCKFVPEVFDQTIRTVKRLSPPSSPKWPLWVDSLPSIRVVNLTKEILADITLKLEQSKAIQGVYKYGMGYEIGTVAAAIKDSFENMLQLYRYYASEDCVYNASKAIVSEYMRAYAVIQGEFNRIRLERNVFRQIRKRFADMAVEQENQMKNLGLSKQQRDLITSLMKNVGKRRRTADIEILMDETFWNSDLQVQDVKQIRTVDITDKDRSISPQKPDKKVIWKHKENVPKVMNWDQFD